MSSTIAARLCNNLVDLLPGGIMSIGLRELGPWVLINESWYN